MNPKDIQKLRHLTNFAALVDYLRDELDWPIEVTDAKNLVFEYDPAELGLDPKAAIKIETLKQIRPLEDSQPWGIFYLEFEAKRLPVVVLRRILHALISCNRTRSANQPVWQLEDLLFISTFGDEAHNEREIAFAHFHQEADALPTLRVLGWDGADTPLKLDHVAATLKAQLRWPADPDDADAWREQWARAFRHRLGHVIRTADALADRLATLARGIRDAATTLMALEAETGPLRRLHKAFQTALIHDLSEADFADTYAQTITYGLLTAAIQRTPPDGSRYDTTLYPDMLAEVIPITNPFLREMLQTFLRVGGRQGGIDFDELGIQDVVDLLRGDETDLPAILRDFGNRTRGEDPVIHFYEHFLAAYDKQLKVKRGIFYTPQPVVSYIVRSVHELLQTEFGLEDGLASTITWGEMVARHADLQIPKGTDPQSPFVVVLDPATGTATFLVEVIDVIHQTLTAKWTQQRLSEVQQRDAWNAYVPQHLLPRLYGYELMMAPYAIAHMKIGLKLHETGYRFGSDERVRIYLTNALEPVLDNDKQLQFAKWFPALAHEAQAVNEVKRRQQFTVVVGNPPYSPSISEPDWLMQELAVWKEGLNETKIDLNREEWKFVRLGQLCCEKAPFAILGYIINRDFLDGIAKRRMRESLQHSFPYRIIIDLNGDVKGNITDQNVFDIAQGVCIAILCRTNVAEHHFFSFVGARNEKYSLLSQKAQLDQHLTEFVPSAPYFRWVPFEHRGIDNLEAEYHHWLPLNEVFCTYSSGIQTKRDGLCVRFKEQELWTTVQRFNSLNLEAARKEFDLGDDGRDWTVARAKADIANSGPNRKYITPLLYRPFDFRYTYWTGHTKGFLAYPRRDVMQHIIGHRNIGMIFNRQIVGDSVSHFGVSRVPICHGTFYLGNKGQDYLAPLDIWSESDLFSQTDSGVKSNFTVKFYSLLTQKLGQAVKNFTFADIFHYIYAIFYSLAYRTRYAEFLKIDFPRLPLTSDVGLFRSLAGLGADLVALHLLEDDYPAASWMQAGQESPLLHPITTFIEGANGTTMGAFSKSACYQDGRVYLDTSNRKGSSYFDGVLEDVWNFHIGGYQVLYKWLYDRRGSGGEPGRTLTEEDIAHYQRIVVALKETIRLMGEIDAVIEEHGGWPID